MSPPTKTSAVSHVRQKTTETCGLGLKVEGEAAQSWAGWTHLVCEPQNSSDCSEGQAPKASDSVKRLRQPALRLCRSIALEAKYLRRQEGLVVYQR